MRFFRISNIIAGEFAVNLFECTEAIRNMFNPGSVMPGEFGVTGESSAVIQRVGYATNLTPETVALASEQCVDLIITHHDAWDFIFGMKDICAEVLERAGIAHLFAHLPLDAADFGTANAFASVLGARAKGKFGLYEGFQCGVISALEEPIELVDLVKRVERVCDEKVRSWQNNDRAVSHLGVFPGACVLTSYVKECFESDCDTFITGETNLYVIQYAALMGINLVAGSHTFTEIFGVEELVNRLLANSDNIRSVRLHESHIESAS